MKLGEVAKEARERIDKAYIEQYNSEDFIGAVTELCEEEAMKGRNSLMVGSIETEKETYFPEDAYIYMSWKTRQYLKTEWGIKLYKEADGDYIFRW